MALRILAVEDDAALQKLLHRGLIAEGHSVEVVGTGMEALNRAGMAAFDAIVLDLSLPDLDGLEVTRAVRNDGNTIPILMLTARDQLTDRLSGFEAGADDYLVKPFAVQELVARLQAITRRSGPRAGNERLVVHDLVLDRGTHEVTRGGEQIHLAPREFAVLELLMAHPGQVFSRTTIMERVWDYSFAGYSNVVDTSIRRLRQALDRHRDHPLIQTVHGVGYKIRAPL